MTQELNFYTIISQLSSSDSKDEFLKSLMHSLTSQELLTIALQGHTNDPQEIAIQKELVKYALDNGADANMLIVGERDQFMPLNRAKNPEIIELLQQHEAKCDPREKLEREFYTQERLKYILSYKKISEDNIKNINAPRAEINKIPYNLFQVWFTHPETPREMISKDIDIVLETHQLLAQDNITWNHVVWTNDKSLIPNSVSILEENGVAVREISKIQPELRLFPEIMEFIEKKKWGVASDTARYNLVYKFGGVYADLNFKFFRSPEDELHKYDFITMGTNDFFAAKAEHPILSSLLNTVEENLVNPPLYIQEIIPDCQKTLAMTYEPFMYGLSYTKESNKNGNVDIIYDYLPAYTIDENGDVKALDQDLPKEKEMNDHPCTILSKELKILASDLRSNVSHDGICLSENLIIGEDGNRI